MWNRPFNQSYPWNKIPIQHAILIEFTCTFSYKLTINFFHSTHSTEYIHFYQKKYFLSYRKNILRKILNKFVNMKQINIVLAWMLMKKKLRPKNLTLMALRSFVISEDWVLECYVHTNMWYQPSRERKPNLTMKE